MILDTAALLAPISEGAPAGEDIRSSDDYERVSSEIDKMTNVFSGGSPVDWALVEQHGAEILQRQSKDFMLAAWVSAAWMERHGVEGLRAGLELHAGLIDNYWETAFPPLKRLRGRRNALTWWVERASGWLESNPQPPLEAARHATLLDAAGRIDQSLAELDPESPPLGNFLRQLKGLDVIAAEPEAGAGPVGGDDGAGGMGSDGSVGNSAGSAGNGTTDAAAAPNAGGSGGAATAPASQAAAITARPASTPAAAAPPALALPADLATLDDIIKALQAVNEHLGRIGGALLEIDRYQPLVIEINRFAARAALLDIPPAQAGATSLSAPPVAIADAFATICGAGNADGIIAFCEARILAFPFWLDLDRQSARGFGMLGEAGAPLRQAVIQNALAFTARLPGIETLTFSDGTPFASEETRQWLEECREQSAGGDAPADAFAAVERQARAAANDGRHEHAMQLCQSFIQASHGGRDALRARIALVELLLAAQGDIDPMPFAQPLIQDCATTNLSDWEPELAAHAWQTVLKACRQALAQPALANDAARRQQYEQIRQDALQRLARLDFVAATRYS